ncbi:hypothetical protein LTS18_001206, partial [Coniosporium uncinatum]
RYSWHGWRFAQHIQRQHHRFHHLLLAPRNRKTRKPSVNIKIWIRRHPQMLQARCPHLGSGETGDYFKSIRGNELCLPLRASLPPRHASRGYSTQRTRLENNLQPSRPIVQP